MLALHKLLYCYMAEKLIQKYYTSKSGQTTNRFIILIRLRTYAEYYSFLYTYVGTYAPVRALFILSAIISVFYIQLKHFKKAQYFRTYIETAYEFWCVFFI